MKTFQFKYSHWPNFCGNMKLFFWVILMSTFLLQGCGVPWPQEKRDMILFFDPLYYMDSYQGPCQEKGDIIECSWNTGIASHNLTKTAGVNDR